MKRLVGPLVVLVAVTYLLALWFTQLDHSVWRPRHFAGIAIIAVSFACWATARLQLGDAFTGRARAHSLVTHGLYARLRNPIYMFAELLWIGMLVFMGQPLLFLSLAISIPLQWWRARNEARVLEAAFGDRYRAYRARTWF
jgi:protein-S-isoprenylcysteine O-methyltransferase Ste14